MEINILIKSGVSQFFEANMTEKKISFGFKQVKKTQVLITSNAVIDKKDAVEMIDCLEGQTIKIIG